MNVPVTAGADRAGVGDADVGHALALAAEVADGPDAAQHQAASNARVEQDAFQPGPPGLPRREQQGRRTADERLGPVVRC